MSLQTQRLFQFGKFVLDVDEKLLKRENEVIPITPKVFDTLEVLVENAGHLVEKDFLMQRIWPDRFVEESNLSFNIMMLRKALDDNAANPRFIATVPRRGYRFIGDVKHLSTNGFVETLPVAAALTGASEHKLDDKFPSEPKRNFVAYGVVGLFCLAVIASVLWFVMRNYRQSATPILSNAYNSVSLTTDGSTLQAAISPDGRYIAYTHGLISDQQSVWIRQLETSNNVQIIPPSDAFYYGLAFSPDGEFLYFVRGVRPRNSTDYSTLFRISVFGGIVSKITDGVQGDFSLSHDGRQVSFVRCPQREDEWCSLWIADAGDGSNERKLVSRPGPLRIGPNRISPDGRSIAFGVGQSRNSSNEFALAAVDLESGNETELTKEKFFNINDLAWLPDQRSILISALKLPDRHTRIWQVSTLKDETTVLTRDSDDYVELSLDNAASQLVATKKMSDFQLYLLNSQDLTKGRQVFGDAASVKFADDGSLLIASERSGNIDIWSIDADGQNAGQLTNNAADDLAAEISADSSEIYFASNRSGETQIWKMNRDGSDQRQITTGEGGFPLAVSPDGKWLYYHSGLGRTLRRVHVHDGVEEVVIDKPKSIFAVSPDCQAAAFVDGQGNDLLLVVMTLHEGHPFRSFRLGDKRAQVSGIVWSHDGSDIYYVGRGPTEVSDTVWVQPIDQRSPRKIAELPGFGLRNEHSLAISEDGKLFAMIQGNWKRDAMLIKGLK